MSTLNLPSPPPHYGGYLIEPMLLRDVDADGVVTCICALRATELADVAAPVVFERRVQLSEAQAALRNLQKQGSLPPQDQLDAELLRIGVTYVRGLIDLVNQGFRTIAPAARRSVSEAQSRLGMTGAALRFREQ